MLGDGNPWLARPRVNQVVAEVLGRPAPAVEAVLRFAVEEVVPRLAAHHRRDRPDGAARWTARFVPAGPSGSPTRGLVNVLPTGRNFYSVDPKAIPSRSCLADAGSALADSLIAAPPGRHRASIRASVGLTVWGTSAMRTQGDDIAEVLALLGLPTGLGRRPRAGSPGSRSMPLAELGRPRIDVTVRISGFFRDAFPHVISAARRRGRGWWPRWTSPPSRTSSAPTSQRRPRRGTATSAARPADLRLQARAPTAPACCR